MASYCESVRSKPKGTIHRVHHDTEHGRAPKDDDDLFRRLMLEISQAGLSFTTILNKKPTIYEVFSSVDKVARFGERDIQGLLRNPGIIRNRLKIDAAIFNARRIKEMQKEHGSFGLWMKSQGNLSKEQWVKLFRKNFKFTGGEIVNEFLMSIGILPGAHTEGCRFYKPRKAFK